MAGVEQMQLPSLLTLPRSFELDVSCRLIISCVIAAYIAYYFFIARSRPKFYAKSSRLSNIFIENIQSVKDVYTPIVWGFTGRMQTILRPIFKRVSPINYETELITLSDGGDVSLSWYSPGIDDDARPIAILLPGLTGCACSHYIVTLVQSIHDQGYRCVVHNNRGTCRQKLKTPKTYSASETNDLAATIDHVRKRYPAAPLTAIGISLGGLILFNYISRFGEVDETGLVGPKCPLKAGMCISMLWKLSESSKSLERPLDWILFNRPLTQLLCRLVNNNADVLSQKFDVPKILKSRSVREFDENMTVGMFGHDSVEDYYNGASPFCKLNRIKIPLFCFVAADDPFVPINTIPLDAIAKSSHVMLLLTKHGGHIGFLDSFLPTGTNLMDRTAAQFCQAVFENLTELEAAEASLCTAENDEQCRK